MRLLLLTADLHRDGAKLLWLLDEAPAHDALLVAGDLLDIFSNTGLPEQTLGALRFRQAVLSSGKSFAWCSGNHDFYHGDRTPMTAASPLWMQESHESCVCDGNTRILEAGGESVAITTIPWPVNGGDLLVNGCTISYHEFVRDLLREGKCLQAEIPWIVLCHEPPGETPLAATYRAIEADFARRMIEAEQPDFSLHGHIHQAPTSPGGLWIWQLGKTICFNAGQSNQGEPLHYILLDLRPRNDWTAIWHGDGRILRAEAGGPNVV
jgi:Icc-related predicted phosphoesterase